MRFYLDFSLVSGYVLMATIACLGMLQLAAARGGYAGLSLFVSERKLGSLVGAGLTGCALITYALFAPEVLTPGPAGSEVAAMFAGCALLALIVTLLGADQRLKRARRRLAVAMGEHLELERLPCILYRSLPFPLDSRQQQSDGAPLIVLIPDPMDIVHAPLGLVESLRRNGIAILAIEGQAVIDSDATLLSVTALESILPVLAEIESTPKINCERIGLLGLGLGGDVALGVNGTGNPKITCSAAVSPVACLIEGLGLAALGIYWLREISYPQAWRLRRRTHAFAQFRKRSPRPDTTRVAAENTAVLCGSNVEMTMRKSFPGIAFLPTAIDRHFTLLEKEPAREVLVEWFTQRLASRD